MSHVALCCQGVGLEPKTHGWMMIIGGSQALLKDDILTAEYLLPVTTIRHAMRLHRLPV